ncbi:hypothetical protein H6F43_01105 [Leptolyngbya sp. FACHB-36]|uniref:hypothetical protein n=1 Tax=Leptolyngbya sp. FACHB-36 TaxID=2692808 RepID=UPI00167FF7D3|nr:hypothetical protein [Leptolyngbya sp. FACHB-36]MBD2018781.1 hypothetical protein [Leptolyngbya sp. FACHB-36]
MALITLTPPKFHTGQRVLSPYEDTESGIHYTESGVILGALYVFEPSRYEGEAGWRYWVQFEHPRTYCDVMTEESIQSL